MDRAEATGLGIAVAGHAALIALFALGLAATRNMDPPSDAMEITFEEETGPVSSAPQTIEEPAPSVGDEVGAPEEASGAEASVAEAVPEPITPPVPEPIRPPTQTEERRRPDVTRSAVPVRPTPQPSPRAAPPQPAPRVAQNQPRAQPRPAQTQPRQQTAPPAAQRPSRPSAHPGQGQAQRSRGFDPNALARSLGMGPPEARGTSPAPRAAVVTAEVRASLDQAILRALQPCQRQSLPAPEARAIRVRVAVVLKQDGSLDSARVVGVNDYDDSLGRYEQRMREVALNVVRQCSPIRGLPAEYYSVSRGWRQFNYTFPRT
jgi:hypothetical protein